MKLAEDFRRIARENLQGKWAIAVVAGLIASLLGAVSAGSPELNVELNAGHVTASLEIMGQTLLSTDGLWPMGAVFAGAAAVLTILAMAWGLALYLLGSVMELGYARFHLDLPVQERPELGTLFRYFPHWKTAVIARLLRSLYVLLWSLLLIIPGIIAGLGYSMTGYILAENPELPAGEALARSKALMEGNKWRLFCLQFSFIGWELLCGLTMGIGNLWLTPYRQAAYAAFYREISGTERRADPETESDFGTILL